MKKREPIRVVNYGADGRIIEDLSKVKIPLDHPVYGVLAAIMRNRGECNATADEGRKS